MYKHLLSGIFLCALSLYSLISQSQTCPANISASTVVVPVTCPSNGSITVNTNIASGTSNASYQIISGPAGGGYSGSAQNSNIFNALPPGNYTIKVSCEATSTNVTAVVPNQYTAPGVNAVVSNVCTNFSAGGTITFNSAGSATPLQYAVLLSNNAAEPDENFSYGTNNVFNVSAYGTYQARVKDACGNFSTQTISIQPTFPKVTLTYDSKKPSDDCSGYLMYYRLVKEGTTTPVDLGTTGYKLEIWESSAAGCAGLPTTTPTKTTVEKGSSALRFFNSTSYDINSFYWRITSPCGEVTQGCANSAPFITTSYISAGCSINDPVSFVLRPILPLGPYTLTITGYDVSNNVTLPAMTVTSSTQIFNNIPYAHHYTYTVQTKCAGLSFTGTVTTPTAAPTYSVFKSFDCTNILGTSRVGFSLNGYIPDIAAMTIANATLVNQATGASYSASSLSVPAGNVVYFNNIPPGNYLLRLTSPNNAACITEIPVVVTVGGQLTYSLDGTATVQCGGTGNINATAITNTTIPIYYKLLNASGNVIAQNSTGTFTNLPIGTYAVVGGINTSSCAPNYETSKSFTIADPGQAPIVSKKYGIICEPASTTGIATFEFTGAAPFLLEMKKASESNFTTVATSVPVEYVVNNLEAGQIYDVRITDACGKTGISQVTIQPLGTVGRLTMNQPCVGQPYSLEVEDIPGATYAWSFNNGPVFSSSSTISFGSYNANNDGLYKCTVTIGQCATREVSYTLNSQLCGGSLFVNFGDINAYIQDDVLYINWSSLSEKNHSAYEIQISNDGKNFTSLAFVNSKSKDGNSSLPLQYTFEKPLVNIALSILSFVFIAVSIGKHKKWLSYLTFGAFVLLLFSISCNNKNAQLEDFSKDTFIRIATIDKDGNKAYSKVIKVVKK